MNGLVGQSSSRCRSAIYLPINLEQSNGSINVRFTKRVKGLHKGDIYT